MDKLFTKIKKMNDIEFLLKNGFNSLVLKREVLNYYNKEKKSKKELLIKP